jgi:hypothetical protein
VAFIEQIEDSELFTALRELDPELRDVLTVGRPIAEA